MYNVNTAQALKIKDQLGLSHEKYQQIRVEYNLQDHIPTLDNFKSLQKDINALYEINKIYSDDDAALDTPIIINDGNEHNYIDYNDDDVYNIFERQNVDFIQQFDDYALENLYS